MQITQPIAPAQTPSTAEPVARAIWDDVSVEVSRVFRGANITGASWKSSSDAVRGAQALSQGSTRGAVGVFREGDHFVASDLLSAGRWSASPEPFELASDDDIASAARTRAGRGLVAIVDGDAVAPLGSYRDFEAVLDSYEIPADERR